MVLHRSIPSSCKEMVLFSDGTRASEICKIAWIHWWNGHTLIIQFQSQLPFMQNYNYTAKLFIAIILHFKFTKQTNVLKCYENKPPTRSPMWMFWKWLQSSWYSHGFHELLSKFNADVVWCILWPMGCAEWWESSIFFFHIKHSLPFWLCTSTFYTNEGSPNGIATNANMVINWREKHWAA